MKEFGLSVLIVDDSPADAAMIANSLADCAPKASLLTANSVERAVELLMEDRSGRQWRPNLIILDLGLPRHSGFELLKLLKDDPVLHSVPVIIVSGSNVEPDIRKAYDLYANAYVTKPVSSDDFRTAICRLWGFWANPSVHFARE